MYQLKHSIILFLFGAFFACNSNDKNIMIGEEEVGTSLVFFNRFGEMELVQKSDGLWELVFTKSSGERYDTMLSAFENDLYETIALKKKKDTFLLGFENLKKDTSMFPIILQEHVFVSPYFIKFNASPLISAMNYGGLGDEFNLQTDLYTNYWFRKDAPVVFYGDVKLKDGKYYMNNLLLSESEMEEGYYCFEGKVDIYHEKSCPDGCLKGVDYKLTQPEPTVYKGYPVNLPGGVAGIAWEFADSEAYVLEGKDVWSEEELTRDIDVSGFLVQNQNGSVLKNWEVIE